MELTDEAGNVVLPLIGRAEDKLEVYSPFISPEYAKKLVEKSEEGVDVTVFTTGNDSDYHQRSLALLSERPSHKMGAKAGGTLLGAGLISLLAAYLWASWLLIISLVLLLGGGALIGRRNPEESEEHDLGSIEVSILENLHAKLYSRDDGEEVAFGSANLTNGGMHGNLEVIERSPS